MDGRHLGLPGGGAAAVQHEADGEEGRGPPVGRVIGVQRAADLWVVLTVAEATPASAGSTPETARLLAEAMMSPMPRPMTTSGTTTSGR
ncbi:hypothetical protein [Actinocorallia aurea]